MTYLYSWSLAYVSSTLGPSSSLKLLLVFMKEIQKIVTNKHKHSQMMSEICRLVEHASWTTKDASFPKNISTFNCLVKYFPVLIFLFFKEALFPLMYFVVFFFSLSNYTTSWKPSKFPWEFISWFNTGWPILSSSLWKHWTGTVLNGSLSVWDKGSYSL